MVTAQPERVGSARPADSTGVGGTPGLRAQYRDYLKNRFIDVAHNSGYQAATPLMLEDALQRRFHQVFSIVDESPQPVLPLLISVVFDALVGPVAQGGFGLDGGQIPPQGKVSDADYFVQLVGMTKVNTSELLNRYRVEFDRSPGELSSPVDLNIEALQGL